MFTFYIAAVTFLFILSDKALVNQLIQVLPQLVQASADSWKNIDNITMFDGAPIAQTFDTIKKATGLDLVDVIQKRAEGTTTIKGSVPTTDKETNSDKTTD